MCVRNSRRSDPEPLTAKDGLRDEEQEDTEPAEEVLKQSHWVRGAHSVNGPSESLRLQ